MLDTPESSSVVPLPLINTPRQQAVAFPSPRKLGDRVQDLQATSFQRRIKAIENRVVATHVNPLAAWPGSSPRTASTAVTTRPPLSIELETYVRREHRELMLSKPDATKFDSLPIFREAFGCIINHFPEYSSVLSLIKSEYDAVLEELSMSSQRASKIEIENKSMKGTHSMQLLQEREKMNSCLSEAQVQLQAALRNNQVQRQHIAKLEHDLAYQEQRMEQRQKDFDESQERIRVLGVTLVEEATKISRYITELTKANKEIDRLNRLVGSLRQLVAEGERTISAFRNSGLDANDSTFRRKSSMRLTAPKQQLHSVTQAATPPSNQRRGSVQSHSPPATSEGQRRPQHSPNNNEEDNDEMQQYCFDLECKVEALEHETTVQKGEIKKLYWKISKLQQTTDRDTLTPRPEWSSAERRLPGLRFEEGRSSMDRMNDILAFVQNRLRAELLENERKAYGEIIWNWLDDENLCESDLLHRNKYFIPRGTSKSIQPYLRASKPVRNRRFKKGDVEVLLNQFWNARFVRRKTIPFPSVEEYWFEWATKETGSEGAAVELSYNIFDVCERFQHDPDCKLFLKIIRGELCELVVADQRDSIEMLLETCESNRIPGDSRITRLNFMKSVRLVFPEKTRDHMTKLRFILALWTVEEEFAFRELFTEDADGNQSQFIEALRKQHIYEIEQFTVEVTECIRQLVKENGMVNVADAMLAVHELDPRMTDSDVQVIFSQACRLTLPDLLGADRSMEVDGESMITRLKLQVMLRRKGPPIAELADDDEEEQK